MRILLIALTVNLIISFDLNAKIASVIGDPVSGDIYFNVNNGMGRLTNYLSESHKIDKPTFYFIHHNFSV